MRRMRAKLLSYVLVVLMIVSLVPASVFAEEEIMSDEFKAILNENGKFVMNTVKPSSMDEAYWFFNETEFMCDNYPDLRFDNFSDDFESCTIYYKWNWDTNSAQEEHKVDIVYNYDKSVKTMVDGIVKNLPKGDEEFGYYFSVKDMELLSWWLNSGDINTMIDYSGELKSYLNYKNFVIDCRMGMDSEFLTQAYGEAPFSYGDILYDIVGMGVNANHVIYVPDGTAATKEALMASAQKRINEYAGEGIAKITYGGQGIRNYYVDLYDDKYEEKAKLLAESEKAVAESLALIEAENVKIADYDEQISQYNMQIEPIVARISELVELRNSEPEKEEEYNLQIQKLDEQRGEFEKTVTELCSKKTESENKKYEYDLLRSQHELSKMNYESECQYVLDEKEYILDSYDQEGGDFYFLQEAAGDYWFNLQIGDKTHMFIVIVDSEGMVNPQYRSSDVATDITVSTNDNSVPLDTRINVEKLTSGEKYDKIIKTLNVKDNLTFDINLFSESLEKNVTKLANDKFEVKIPMGAQFKDKSLVVYYVDQNLQIKEYTVTIRDGYATFETDHFSIYTLAEAVSTKEKTKVEITEETVKEAVKEAGNDKTVVLPLEDKTDNVTSVQLPVTSVKTVIDAKKDLQIETSKVTATFNVKALEKIAKDAGTTPSITLKLEEIKKDVLNVKQQEAIKNETVEMVISAELLCNDKLITEFGGGKVELKIPFIPPKGTEGKDYKVLHIADDGKIEEIDTSYKSDCIVIQLEHFSEYVIVRDVVAEQPPTNVKPGDNANLYLWFGLLGITTTIVYKTKRKSVVE
ncbi:MAG: hypothetical protein IJD58_00315 [Lachnospiraceae bacterium]|nr:hypothetical protein [Lachnospiraceae bacterium]